MGEPKALLRLEGATLVERAVDRLRDACSPIVVVAQATLALPPLPSSVRVVRDPLDDAGPLVGLLAGLESIAASEGVDWVFVCAVDAPFVSTAVVERLVGLGDDDVDAVVPRFDGDTFPLTALYARRVAAVARELVDGGERRARMLAASVRARFVGREELVADARVVDADPHLETFFNVNTRAHFEHALSLCARTDGRAPNRG